MMKRVLLYGSVILSIVFVFLFAQSTNYLKKPFSHNDDVQLHISNLNTMIDNKDWAGAEMELKDLEKAWGQVVKRIQFTGEEDDIKKINESIYKLKYMLRIRDVPNSTQELANIEYGWNDIGR